MGARVPSDTRRAGPAALGLALLGLGLCLWQLSLPGHLLGITEYDDGVYLGAALRLVSGAMPYRDFVFVQPPGIVVLMSPVALIAHLAGTPAALALTRVVTGLVAGLDAGLVAWLVHGRGRVAMVIAGGGTALFPLAVVADHTLLLEPYLVALVLAGAFVAFRRPLPSRARLLAAGACFGAAGAVKLWAIFPFLALLGIELVRSRWRAGWLVAGAAGAFGALCLPFLLSAPSAFVHEVLLDQLGRGSAGANAVPLGTRLVALTGVAGVPALPHSAALAAAVLGVLAVGVVVAAVLSRAAWRWVDTYLVAAAGASVAGLLAAPEFYGHYATFTAPFLAALAAIAVTGTLPPLWRRLSGDGLSGDGLSGDGLSGGRGSVRVAPAARTMAVVCGCLVAAALLASDVAYDRHYLPASLQTASGAIVDPGPAVARVVPPGACVVFDDPVLAIEADRFSSSRPGCPSAVDPYGMWLADAAGRAPFAPPPYPEALVAAWRAELSRADDVVLTSASSGYVPWTPALRSFLARHFSLVLTEQDAAVYARRKG